MALRQCGLDRGLALQQPIERLVELVLVHFAKAKHLADLAPKPARVEEVLPTLSGGSQQLLAAMASFYDPAWGEELAARTGDEKSVCGLTFNLDHEEMSILCELLLNYCGWDED